MEMGNGRQEKNKMGIFGKVFAVIFWMSIIFNYINIFATTDDDERKAILEAAQKNKIEYMNSNEFKEKHKNDIIGMPTATDNDKERLREESIKDCISKLKEEKHTGLIDRGQCVKNLIELNADPKTILPLFLDRMKNDKDMDVRKTIIQNLGYFGKDEKILKDLKEIGTQPISEQEINTLKKKNKGWNLNNTIQYDAVKTLISFQDANSIPIMIDWLSKHDFDFFHGVGLVPTNSKTQNFRNKCIAALNSILKSNNVDPKIKISSLKVMIIDMREKPETYLGDFVQEINNSDEKITNETLELLGEISNSDEVNNVAENKQSKKVLIDKLWPIIKNIKRSEKTNKYIDILNTVHENKGK